MSQILTPADARRAQAIRATTTGARAQIEAKLQAKLAQIVLGFQLAYVHELERQGMLAQLSGHNLTGPDREAFADQLTREVFQRLPAILVDPTFEARLQGELFRAYSVAFEAGAVVGLNQIGFAATSDSVNRLSGKRGKVEAIKALKLRFRLGNGALNLRIFDRATAVAKQAVASAVEATRRTVRDLVVAGGVTVGGAVAKLKKDRFATRYAAKLALTESHAAYEEGQHETFKKSGVLYHYWLTVGDNRVRPWHVTNEAEGLVKIGEPFPSGQVHPGDGPLSINCRCSVIPEINSILHLLAWDGT